MEWLNTVWGYVLPIGGGLTVGAIIVGVLSALFKGWTTKFTQKIDLAAIEKKAVDQGIEKIKNISFTQTIQPVVESGLQKVLEKAQEYINAALSVTDERYMQLILIMQKFACYFDNAVGVPQQVKDGLKAALNEAGIATVEPTTVVVVETPVETEKTATTANDGVKTDVAPETSIER